MTEYSFKIGQNGFSASTAFVVEKKDTQVASTPDCIAYGDAKNEITALRTAVKKAQKDFEKALSAGGTKEFLAIMETSIQLLNDPGFIPRAEALIAESGCSAQHAVNQTAISLASSLEATGDSYIKQRAEDIRGLAGNLIDILNGTKRKQLDHQVILVADELSPAEIAHYDHTFIAGIVTGKGSPTSHVSILAGNMGVPYLYGNQEAVAHIQNGDQLIIKDDTLTHNPDDATWSAAVSHFKEEQERVLKLLAQVRAAAAAKAASGDTDSSPFSAAADTEIGTHVFANIGRSDEVSALAASGAQGVGLFRSEFLFLDAQNPPSEDE